MLEVVDPAPHEAVQFFNAFLYRFRRGLAGGFPDFPFEPLPTFPGYAQPIFAPFPFLVGRHEAVAQQGEVDRAHNLRFLLIDLNMEFQILPSHF